MSEHLIRLRGGWEAWDLDRPGAGSSRLTLPVQWTTDAPRRLRLLRRFQAPRLQAPGGSLWLRLGRVPGLMSIALNGRPLSPAGGGQVPIERAVESLRPRNELELRVERLDAGTEDWGEVALVIRERATAPDRPLA